MLPRAVLFALSVGARYDIDSYRMVELALHLGQKLYDNPELAGRYPYPPAWAWVLRGLGAIGRMTGGAPWHLFKLPGLLADFGVLCCLIRLAGPRAWPVALAYALSPLAFLTSAGHGQFDAVVLLGVLLALLAVERGGLRAGLWAGLGLGAAVCFKPWPLFLAPLFVGALPRRQRAAFGAALLGLPALLLAPWILNEGLGPVLARLAYGGANGISMPQALSLYGMKALSPARMAWPFLAWKACALLVLLVVWLRAWRPATVTGLRHALERQSLALLVFAPAVSIQYLYWPLPWLALNAPKRAWAFSAGAAFMQLAYYRILFPEALLRAWTGHHFDPAIGWAWAWGALNLALWALLVWAFVKSDRQHPRVNLRPALDHA